MRFEGIFHSQKNCDISQIGNFGLSKIRESDAETNDNESYKNLKISISSVRFDSDAENLKFKKMNSPAKPLSIISQFHPVSNVKQGTSYRTLYESKTNQGLSSFKPRVMVKDLQIRPNNFKDEEGFNFRENKISKMACFENLSFNKRISWGSDSNRNNYFSEMAQAHYKNDFNHLISICEDLREKKLNEISGNELIQYLSVPGISRIQKLMRRIKQELVRSKRMRINLEGTDEDHSSLVQLINGLAFNLQSLLDKKITRLKFLNKQQNGKDSISSIICHKNKPEKDQIKSQNPNPSLTLRSRIFKKLRNNAPKQRFSKNRNQNNSIDYTHVSKSIKFSNLALPEVLIPKKKAKTRTRHKLKRNIKALRRSIEPLMNHSFII
ncbi:unnamed protein product [Moneuplotes crassus]|uniref:Uncharacterized protein n=1 Tax=Euplotes crassus TaxID=5936 RepID=A0AAD1UGB1_EUPCR|nr:unnamed protein product [Moneuplotes crassus]